LVVKQEELLFVIPARGGSKGIPGKNYKLLNGKPLIHYSIDLARKFVPDQQICVTSDDENILQSARSIGLVPPFTRPAELATDISGTYETLLHAVSFYKNQGYAFSTLILLQPTSPFRRPDQLQQMLGMYNSQIDMLVSVRKCKDTPYYNIFEEDQEGFLTLSKNSSYNTRQECPPVYTYNGAFYIINIDSLIKTPLNKFTRIKKYLMDDLSSTDLDTILEWKWAEFLLKEKLV
jgi:CMP-N,N'-diacetyllegionaminic acid synthase